MREPSPGKLANMMGERYARIKRSYLLVRAIYTHNVRGSDEFGLEEDEAVELSSIMMIADGKKVEEAT